MVCHCKIHWPALWRDRRVRRAAWRTRCLGEPFDGIAPEPLSAGTDTDLHLLLSGYLKVSTLTLSTGWISRTVNFSKALPSTVRTRLWFAGTSWNIAPDIVWATQLYRIANPEHDTRATLVTLVTTRAMYLLSKASALYVQVGYLTTVPMSRTA